METEIKFNELENFKLVKKEINNLFTNDFSIIESSLMDKQWVYASLDGKQILEEDAINLSSALRIIGCNEFYASWACHFFLDENDFFIKKLSSEASSIEKIQDPHSVIDHLDSFLFSGYPLKFLIFRPDSNQNLMYALGASEFINEMTKACGWRIHNA